MGIRIEVHGVRVSIRGADRPLHRHLYLSMSTFGFPMWETDVASETDKQKADLEVAIRYGEAAPPRGTFLGRSEEGLDLYREGSHFLLAGSGVVFRVDPEQGVASGCVPSHETPEAFSAASRSMIVSLLLLLRPRGFAPLHAAALAHGGRGLLVAAPSGSGKSTLAYSLVKQGWKFLSDDSVLLYHRRECVEALALRRLFAVKEESRVQFPELVPHWSTVKTDKHKRLVELDEAYPGQAVERSVPRALLFPRLVDKFESEVRPLSKVRALQLLAEQSAFSLLDRTWTKEHFVMLGHLVSQAPPYQLLAGRDLLEQPRRCHQLIAPLLDAAAPVA